MFFRKCFFIFIITLFVASTSWAQDLTHIWSRRLGDSGGQFGNCVVIDNWGNIIVAGNFWGTVDFGGGPLIGTGPADEYDIFLAKLDTNGNHLWSKRFGDTGWEYAHGIAVDGAGNIIFVGGFTQTVDFGGGVMTSAGHTDIFVAKFDMDGNHIWSKRFGDSHDSQRARDVALDESGAVMIIGPYYGTIDFGGGPLTSAGLHDIFLAKFDADGNHLWSKRFGGLNNESGHSLAIDAAGNITTTGIFKEVLDLGGGPLTSAGGFDIFLARFDSNGNHLQSRRFGDSKDQRTTDLAVDETGNSILVGYFLGSVDFGGGPLVSAGNSDIFAAKLDAGGNHIWSKRFGDEAEFQHANSVAVDKNGNIFMCGSVRGIVDFGGGPLEGVGEYDDVFIAAFDAGGRHFWSGRFGDSNGHSAEWLAAGLGGDVVVTGWASGSIDFGGGILMPNGSYDIFIAKFSTPIEPLRVMIDIKPGSCPNPLNTKIFEKPAKKDNPQKGGVLPVAILGTPDFDVFDINTSTLLFENVPPLRYAYEDVATPVVQGEGCECSIEGSDGYMDLTLTFRKSEIITQMGRAIEGGMVELMITGQLNDGAPFEGADCVKIIGTSRNRSQSKKDEITLGNPMPNPFNPLVRIAYNLPKDEYVELSIYDVTGKCIRTLVAGQQPVGQHIIDWNAEGLPSGVYFYSLKAGGKVITKKMVLIQ